MKKLFFLFAVLLLVSPLFASGRGGAAAPAAGGAAAPVKLSWYEGLGSAAQGGIKSYSEVPAWQELQRRLNVEIEFRHPVIGNETEQFNLMIASRDFPDIVINNWANVPGGPSRYIEDEVILKLNDVITQWAPDLQKAFQKFPTAKREATLDDGTIYCFPCIYSNDSLAYFYGPFVRKDLLDKVPGVDASAFPGNMETLDEWEKVLTAVKNSGLKGDSGRDIIPLAISLEGNYYLSAFIVGAWNIGFRFTQENGKAVYGPADPRYREYLNLMRRWYSAGLIDPEYPANHASNNRILTEKALDNRAFALNGSMGTSSTMYTAMARPTNPSFSMRTTKYPVLRKGDRPNLAFRTNSFTGTGAAITTSCENVEMAAKVINYDYSDAGYVLSNFGIEGQTFNWEAGSYVTDLPQSTHGGYPRYMDIIMNHPNGYPRDVTCRTIVRVSGFVGIKSGEFLEQRDNLPEQIGPQGRALWMDTENRNRMPAISATPEEAAEMARIMNEVNTYVDEMTIKFITGVEPLTDARYTEYLQNIQRMGLARAVEITNAQIVRYNSRP